jgi:hypothetical protein
VVGDPLRRVRQLPQEGRPFRHPQEVAVQKLRVPPAAELVVDVAVDEAQQLGVIGRRETHDRQSCVNEGHQQS